MQQPLQITSRDFVLTEAIETRIRKHAAALETYFDRLTGCHVVLDAPAVSIIARAGHSKSAF